MIKVLTLDAEIRNKIPDKKEAPNPEYQYCEGWKDYTNMGISFLFAYCNWNKRIWVYDENNINDVKALIKTADLVTGYNIFGFDTALLKATLARKGHPEETGMKGKCYDMFYDIKKALKNNFPRGWTMDNVSSSTTGIQKNGEGAKAPELWQDGELAKLINYGSQDVYAEAMLFEHIWEKGWVNNDVVSIEQLPLDGLTKFRLEHPEA